MRAMAKNTDPVFDYRKQCVTCNLGKKVVRFIHESYLAGVTYRTTSAELEKRFGITISEDAISNHIRRHTKLTEHVEKLTGANTKTPTGWTPRIDMEGNSGEVTTPPITAGPNGELITDFSDILSEMGIDPNVFEVEGTPRVSKWQTFNGDWLTAYKLRIRKKSEDSFDLPTLYAEAKAAPRGFPKPYAADYQRTLVVPFADLQAGKVGSRGDSKALIYRAQEKLERLEEYISVHQCDEAIFLDGGDIVESFENTGQQAFTNDLSIMGQLDLAGTIEQDYISLLARTHNKVRVAGVPSNHGAWRKGKDVLGRPSDDWGLFLIKQIEKAYKLNPAAYGHVEFVYPADEWDKSLNLDVQGIGLGLVHGDDVSSMDAIPKWWASQVHGASPIAKSDILISNHYHTFRVQPTGRSLVTGKQKYWIATPTLDNGSDWFKNKAGADSDPGLMAFIIDSEQGFDLQSFTVL